MNLPLHHFSCMVISTQPHTKEHTSLQGRGIEDPPGRGRGTASAWDEHELSPSRRYLHWSGGQVQQREPMPGCRPPAIALRAAAAAAADGWPVATVGVEHLGRPALHSTRRAKLVVVRPPPATPPALLSLPSFLFMHMFDHTVHTREREESFYCFFVDYYYSTVYSTCFY